MYDVLYHRVCSLGHVGVSFYFIVSGSVIVERMEEDKFTGEQHKQVCQRKLLSIKLPGYMPSPPPPLVTSPSLCCRLIQSKKLFHWRSRIPLVTLFPPLSRLNTLMMSHSPCSMTNYFNFLIKHWEKGKTLVIHDWRPEIKVWPQIFMTKGGNFFKKLW